MPELLNEASVLFGNSKEQILYDHAVKTASRGAGGNNTLYFKEKNSAVLYSNHIIQKRPAFRSYICLSEYLSDTDLP